MLERAVFDLSPADPAETRRYTRALSS